MVKTLVILFFTASWCPSCKVMEPIVEELQTEGYDIKIVEDKKTFKEYGITLIPTLWVDGKKHIGRKTIDQYREYMTKDMKRQYTLDEAIDFLKIAIKKQETK